MSQKGQWIIVLAIVGLLGGALIAGLALSPTLEPVGVGSKAPEFQAVDVATGDTVGLNQYQGEVVLLNIWATWCVPCEQEMPSMQRLHEELADSGLRIVAVSVDDGSREMVRSWTDERGLTFDILHDQSGRISRLYQTTGVPESFVIDTFGIIVEREIGWREWDHPAHKALFRRLLGASEGRVADDGS
ncbi:MAG: redoxin domain-containing protein [Gemmatimonadales bacterium]|nr:redoxin domain-containing protein [Gemmatimonadales bacterium]NIN10757.1 redoxin domain-containing protein [Gemmatimonadales bacterium]NIS63806.1 redoxin domain-containing protein [Gemmatimonadales bacterium]